MQDKRGARTPDCISLINGALYLYFLRDPQRTHDAVVPSLGVPNRAAALDRLQAAKCSFIPIGPHAPGECCVKDMHGIIFNVIERSDAASPAL